MNNSRFKPRLKSGVMSYLTPDSCQAARTRLWLTKTPAVAPAGLPGEAQGMKLPLLVPVDAFHPCCEEESLPLSGGVRLKESSVSVVDVDVIVLLWDLIHR